MGTPYKDHKLGAWSMKDHMGNSTPQSVARLFGLALSLSPLFGSLPSCDSARFVLGHIGDSGGEQGGAGGEGSGSCGPLFAPCSAHSDCCDKTCSDRVCVLPASACAQSDAACSSPLDCCSLSCMDGACGSQCTQDGDACDQEAQCCSGLCEGSVCAALSDRCRTSGNPCDISGDCCSGLCDRGFCSREASYCGQTDDLCWLGGDCCSGVCLAASAESPGVCDDVPSGPSNCTGVAGTLCDDCNDCCSRVCLSYGGGPTKACLQAQGCHQTGELCQKDIDCCGGDLASGLPGAGNVTCEKDLDADFGICRNAISCSPQGNTCHIQDYVCSVSAAAAKCCSEDGAEGRCMLDDAGVPRCDGLGECQAEGDACAMSEDCCDGECVFDPTSGFSCLSEEGR